MTTNLLIPDGKTFEQKAIDFAAAVQELLLSSKRHGYLAEHMVDRILFLADDLRDSLPTTDATTHDR